MKFLLYICKYVRQCDKGSMSEGFKRNVPQNVRIYIVKHVFSRSRVACTNIAISGIITTKLLCVYV